MNLTLASIMLIVAANLAYVNSFILNCTSDTPHVDTPLGGIRGFYNVSYHGRRYAAFEGIPYALPPTGELRFRPPQRAPACSRDINATAPPDACSHYNAVFGKVAGKEDCLYLSTYVPVIEGKNLSLPVLFWIHGGGFQRGTSSNYRARYLMDKDVIFITFNYRIGVFGFLSTGDDVVPGNMGLKDQNLALRWVNENIEHFGGDPKKITIAGDSSGGASVHYHYLAPASRGLFRSGISFSGTALGSWSQPRNTLETARRLASAVNCTTADTTAMIECLKKVSAEDVIEAVQGMSRSLPASFMMFPPVAENATKNYFVNESPEEMIKSGDIYDAPWITGIVRDDGLFMTGTYILNDTAVSEIEDSWETRYAPYALNYKFIKPESEQAELAKKIKRHYFGEKSFNDDKRNFTALIGDGLVAASSIKAAQMQARYGSGPVWFYHYTYRAAQSYADALSSNSTVDLGVSHEDDIYLVLENRFINPTTTAKDREMLEEMLDSFWYSFVSGSEPKLGIEWKTLNSDLENFRYMRIVGPKNYAMEVNDDFREVKFWDSLGLL